MYKSVSGVTGATVLHIALLLAVLALLSTTTARAERTTLFDISPAGSRIALDFSDSHVEAALKLAGKSVDSRRSLIVVETQLELMVNEAQQIARDTAGGRFPKHEVDSMVNELETIIQQIEGQPMWLH